MFTSYRGGPRAPADECPNRVREHRLTRGLSIAQLAKIAGMDCGHLASIERGRVNMGPITKPKLMAALGVREDELYREGTKDDNV